jgi:hypothetical protein
MNRRRQKTAGELADLVADWNTRYPVGTKVKYFPVIGGLRYGETKTLTAAWVLSGHTAVINVEGVSGCVALEACRPV